MTAHKHAEMIKAKADNMDLVVFCKGINKHQEWHEIKRFPNWQTSATYFLCLPQHKEACLHWLNGGDVQCKDRIGWYDVERAGYKWRRNSYWINDKSVVRIKPLKEKRWIGYCSNTNQTFPHPQSSRESAENFAARSYGYSLDKWQFIEIEVEV